MKIEVNVPIAASADARDGETPEERSSTSLDCPDITDDQAWAVMVKYARLIDEAGYRYNVLAENSNAFVDALLHAAEGQPSQMLPTGIRSSETPGSRAGTTSPEMLRHPPTGSSGGPAVRT